MIELQFYKGGFAMKGFYCNFKKFLCFNFIIIMMLSFVACSGKTNVIKVETDEKEELLNEENVKIDEIDFEKTYQMVLSYPLFEDKSISILFPKDFDGIINVEKNRVENDDINFLFYYKNTNYYIFKIIASKSEKNNENKVGDLNGYHVYFEINKKVNPKSVDGAQINYILENIENVTKTISIKEATEIAVSGDTEQENVQVTDNSSSVKAELSDKTIEEINEEKDRYGYSKVEEDNGYIYGYRTYADGTEIKEVIQEPVYDVTFDNIEAED